MVRRLGVVVVAAALCCSIGWATLAPEGDAAQRPVGGAKPTAGSGIGTEAALENPRCRTDEQFMPFGRFDSALFGDGPPCVKPWSADADNGGATAPGVTADAVTVVVVIANPTQNTPVKPRNRATNADGTWQDSFADLLRPYLQYHEMWGRAIDLRFVESSGDDEAAQRADAVKIKALEPFAVIDLVSGGLDVLDAELANSKVLTYGYASTYTNTQAQAPYRWGHSDTQANVVNAAEVIGKQLAGKKARFGGSDVAGQTRKFAMISIEEIIDVDLFKSSLRKWGGAGATLAAEGTYTATGATTGDPATAQQQAPVLVQRMKDAGVTTVILVTDAAMARAAMTAATEQDYFPEWFFTGALFADIPLLARSYPQEQMIHAFGAMTASPWVREVATGNHLYATDTVGPVNWFFGPEAGTTASPTGLSVRWLVRGIHAAGPKLTPRTFTQGLFSLPARFGAADGVPTGAVEGFGRTVRLPYDQYLSTGADFTTFWWDPELVGPGAGTGTEGTGNQWFLDGGKRYLAGQVPTKSLGWFSEGGAIQSFETSPVPAPEYAADCTGCPTSGGTATPGAPNDAAFRIEYFDASETKSEAPA